MDSCAPSPGGARTNPPGRNFLRPFAGRRVVMGESDRQRSVPMRLQLALNVRDLDEAVAYYSKLFAAEPHKVRPGYANFAIDDRRLNI